MDPDWAALLRPPTSRIIELMVTEGGLVDEDDLIEGVAAPQDAATMTLEKIAAGVELSKPSIIDHLRRMERLGVIERKGVGARTAYYVLRATSLHLEFNPTKKSIVSWASVGRQYPSFPLLSQVHDEAARLDLLFGLQAIRKASGRQRPFVVLFGSGARDELTWKSDLDLMLVVDAKADREAILDAIAGVQVKRPLKYPIRVQFADRQKFPDPRRSTETDAANEGMVLDASPTEVDLWSRMARHKRISI